MGSPKWLVWVVDVVGSGFDWGKQATVDVYKEVVPVIGGTIDWGKQAVVDTFNFTKDEVLPTVAGGVKDTWNYLDDKGVIDFVGTKAGNVVNRFDQVSQSGTDFISTLFGAGSSVATFLANPFVLLLVGIVVLILVFKLL